MDYNKKFQSMLDDAKEHGYIFENGKFIRNKKDFIPVMEVFLQMKTTYESSGCYYIYKQTFKISEKKYELIMDYVNKMNYKTVNFEDEFDEEIYENIILKYLSTDEKCDLFELDLNGIVSIQNNTYCKYDEESECGDLWFDYPINNTESSFPIGYISFYKMRQDDFDKMDNINVWLNKFMRDN